MTFGPDRDPKTGRHAEPIAVLELRELVDALAHEYLPQAWEAHPAPQADEGYCTLVHPEWAFHDMDGGLHTQCTIFARPVDRSITVIGTGAPSVRGQVHQTASLAERVVAVARMLKAGCSSETISRAIETPRGPDVALTYTRR